MSNENSITQIDETDPSITYIGKAARGSSDSEAVWQIQRIEVTGSLTKVKYAQGLDTYAFIWNNRSTYTYK